MSIDEWLAMATKELSSTGIPSARLDAELILSHTIRKPRTYLHAHNSETIESNRKEVADARLRMRLERTPIAYIVGHKEFYGRHFKTTPAALIPRPESETIIELLKEIVPKSNRTLSKIHLIDVGTGTGCLGISAKLEWPELDVTLTDTSQHALNLAHKNADLLGAEVHFLRNNLLRGLTAPIDIIIANLPYVDRIWDISPETNNEPDDALFAHDGGLALIFQLIEQASQILKPGGHLLLESDKRQQSDIITFAKKHTFEHRKTSDLITYFVHA